MSRDYARLRPFIESWSKRHGLQISQSRHMGTFKSYIQDSANKNYMIEIDLWGDDTVTVWSYEFGPQYKSGSNPHGPEKKSIKMRVPIQELASALDAALVQVEQWIHDKGFSRVPYVR